METKMIESTKKSSCSNDVASSTQFNYYSEPDTQGYYDTFITPDVKDPLDINSYGTFYVKMLDIEGKEIYNADVEVKPDIGIQLPQTIIVTHPNGDAALGCRIMLVIFSNTSDGSNSEKLIMKGVTNENGILKLSEEFEDGTYILRIFPSTSSAKAYEASFIVALGLRNQQANIDLDPLPTAYNSMAGVTAFAGETKDSNDNSMDLGRDLLRAGGLSGCKLALLILYWGNDMQLNSLMKAFNELEIVADRFMSFTDELRETLHEYCQLWVISSNAVSLSSQDVELITKFWEDGNGLYIWGDNDPWYADANLLGSKFIGATMSGNVPGQQKVGKTLFNGKAGFVAHSVFTGIGSLYEGVTIATLDISSAIRGVQPIMWGSVNNLVTAAYDQAGQRLLIDGGFTRLGDSWWDTAGTPRFIRNCVGWLANLEHFRKSISKMKT